MFRRNERRGGAAVRDLRRRRLAESTEPKGPTKMVATVYSAMREPWGPDGVTGSDHQTWPLGLPRTFVFEDRASFIEGVEEIVRCYDESAIDPVVFDEDDPGRVTFNYIGDDNGIADPDGEWLYEYDVICECVVEHPMTHAELLRHFKPYGD